MGCSSSNEYIVFVVSFNLFFKKDEPADDLFEDNSARMLEKKAKTITAQIAEDIDGNGRVDIIDAYIMDRKLMSGVTMPKDMDFNGDGNIDHEDIKTIVKTAVLPG